MRLSIRNEELGIRNANPIVETTEQVCESYEAAMHYDCIVCAKDCQFRKGPNTTSERIAVACCMLFCAIIAITGIIQGINYLGSLL